MNIYLPKNLEKKRFEVFSERLCGNRKPELFRKVIPQSKFYSYMTNFTFCDFAFIPTWSNLQ